MIKVIKLSSAKNSRQSTKKGLSRFYLNQLKFSIPNNLNRLKTNHPSPIKMYTTKLTPTTNIVGVTTLTTLNIPAVISKRFRPMDITGLNDLYTLFTTI
jgi:hypothetical protein